MKSVDSLAGLLEILLRQDHVLVLAVLIAL